MTNPARTCDFAFEIIPKRLKSMHVWNNTHTYTVQCVYVQYMEYLNWLWRLYLQSCFVYCIKFLFLIDLNSILFIISLLLLIQVLQKKLSEWFQSDLLIQAENIYTAFYHPHSFACDFDQWHLFYWTKTAKPYYL